MFTYPEYANYPINFTTNYINVSVLHAAAGRHHRRTPTPPMIFRPRSRRRFQTAYMAWAFFTPNAPRFVISATIFWTKPNISYHV